MVSKDATRKDEIVQLKTQYRMHPDIGDAVSRIVYNGALVHSDSTRQVDPYWLSAAHWLKSLGPAWNQRRRIGVDVSNPLQGSSVFENTTSMQNTEEARLVAELIRAALNHTIPAEDEASSVAKPLRPKDFLVVTPYQGQKVLIEQNLIQNGVNKHGQKHVRLHTFRTAQGDESRFVVLSMVKNITGKPTSLSFIQDKEALNLAMSRAKQCLFVVGNIRSWVQASVDGATKFTKKSYGQYVFGQFFADMHAKGDIVSNHDFSAFVSEGKTPAAAEFPTLITTPAKLSLPKRR
ncbi:hypothetical protein MBLNU230_g2420t1 [Neophaeotheca triangularis]